MVRRYAYGRTTRRRYSRRKGYGGTTRRPGFTRRVGNYGRFSGGYRKLRRPELKFHDLAFAGGTINVPTAAIFKSINLVAQGTDISQRVSSKFTIKSIQVSLHVNMAQSTVGQALRIRGALVQDSQANGALPVFLDYYKTSAVNSMRVVQNVQRFRTLKDWNFAINSGGLAGNGTIQDSAESFRVIKFYKKCNIPIHYNATAAAVSGVQSNNVCFILFDNNAVPAATLTGVIRIRYSDY